MPNVSVIIPTHNRASILRKTLTAYLQQTARGQILEIAVVDDGSTDNTVNVVREIAVNAAIPIICLHQENRGPGSARNLGMRQAKAEIILLGDDDVIPASEMVAHHLSWHAQNPDRSFAVVGSVLWSPEIGPTPLMNWWGLNGLRFDPPYMKRGHEVSYAAGLFLNTSIKTEFLRESELFDERFREYGYEDVEFAYRLVKRGLRMIYNPDAVGYHYKRVSFPDMCRRVRTMVTTSSLQIFESTEAGRCYLQAQERRRQSRRYRLQKQLARILVPPLAFLKPLLDSRIPLPGPIYAAFLAYYGTLKSEQNTNAQSAR